MQRTIKLPCLSQHQKRQAGEFAVLIVLRPDNHDVLAADAVPGYVI
jgi:hypothetical protein